MDEQMIQKFEKSDKSLKFMHTLLLVTTIILIIGCWVAAIIFWANSTTETYNRYSHYSHTETNGAMIGYGFLIAIGGTLLFALLYFILMFFLWLAFDIKVMRTVSTNCEYSEPLKKFAKPNNRLKNFQTRRSITIRINKQY